MIDVELEKITFKNKNESDPNFPTGYEPINDTNLNLLQKNIDTALTGIQNNMKNNFVYFSTVEEWEG